MFEMQYERPEGSDTTPISDGAAASLLIRISNGQAAYNQLYGGAQTGDNCGTTTTLTGGPDCSTATGDTKILCAAEPYAGIYYEYGGGHEDYSTFIAACPDPSNPPDNQPHGGPVNDDPRWLWRNASPCATDCSGLVGIAVDAAFHQNSNIWGVSNFFTSGDWESIPLRQIAPGDIVTQGTDHVEIVYNYNPTSGVLETFGPIKQAQKPG